MTEYVLRIAPLAVMALTFGWATPALTASAATSGTWSVTGSMTTVRDGDTATLLANGEALAAGGDSNTATLASTELYNPASGQWALTGSMNAPREAHTATLLPDGQVLAAGGSGNSSALEQRRTVQPGHREMDSHRQHGHRPRRPRPRPC